MYVTNTPGTGGKIKQTPEDFLVEEIPLYKPSGTGGHIYLYIEKRDISTTDMISHLKKTFKLKDSDIGIAGWKDKKAVTRQWISMPADKYKQEELPFEILQQTRHEHKLRTGKLKGNNFTITIRDVEKDSFEHAKQTIEILQQIGMPNYYGEQRFGIENKNIERGRELLKKKSKIKINRMLVSSFSSYLFNTYLDQRIKQNTMNKLIQGDVAKKHDTGGLFVVEDVEKEQPRADRFEISPTGPIFGKKMTQPQDKAEKLENEILKKENLNKDDFNLQTGTRRFLRVPLNFVEIQDLGQDIKLNFFLPVGSYATVLLKEIMKSL